MKRLFVSIAVLAAAISNFHCVSLKKIRVSIAVLAVAISNPVQALTGTEAKVHKPAGTVVPARSQGSLMENFVNPPQDARPQVWWHWMNGNISKEGIRKDIEWMNRAGVGGFHHFDAGLNTPQIVDKRMVFMAPDWNDAFSYAMDMAGKYDMDVTIASSPGWSATGGPWVKKEDSMKTLNWREVTVRGGRRFRGLLPEGTEIPGKYLTHQLFYDRNHGNEFYRDIAVIAVRLPDGDRSLEEMGATISTSNGADVTLLTDGDINKVCDVQPDGSGFAWIQFGFPDRQTIKSISTFTPDNHVVRSDYALECSDDGRQWKDILTQFPESNAPFQVIDICPTTAKYFRIRNSAQGSPMDYTELYLHGVTKVNLGTEKAGFFCSDLVLEEHRTPATDDAVPEDGIMDITRYFKDGILDWKVPAGRWKIFRFGYNLRGRFNNPASPEATGLEVDKFDPVAVERYWRDYLDIFQKASGNRVGKGLNNVLIDSFEAGCQTWTGKMAEEFRSRRGYDLMKWLPALAGQVLISSEETERFLDDWRQTQADLFTDYHYRSLERIMNEYGLKRYTESIENSRSCILDGIEVESTGDYPMGAFWMTDEGYSSYAGCESDIREAASAAHIYGKEMVAAESFTADGRRMGKDALNGWDFCPASLKPAADAAMASGLTRFVIHCSTHQPADDKVPGLGLGPYGQWFHRHETWAEEARPWTDYLARSSWMLRQGNYVADIAYYYGESTNITARFHKERPYIPEGYSFDYVNRKALVEDCVLDGKELVAPSCVRYRVLMLDDRMGCMSVKTLRRIKEIADAGVLISGPEPERRYGTDGSDEEFRNLISSIWHSQRPNVCLFGGLSRKMADFGILPALSFPNPDRADIRFVHRRLDDGAELFWIANLDSLGRKVDVHFNVSNGTPVVLHADYGTAEIPQFRQEGGKTIVTLCFSRDDAQFVVFGRDCREFGLKKEEDCLQQPAGLCCGHRNSSGCEGKTLRLDGKWTVKFQEGRGAPESIEMQELYPLNTSRTAGVRYFSGKASYCNSFNVRNIDGGRILLKLGRVCNMAHVYVNGRDIGLLWKEPFETDITEAVKEGGNSLEVVVTNSWVNRLIGDHNTDEDSRITYVAVDFYSADSPLRPSGLIGPVEILQY